MKKLKINFRPVKTIFENLLVVALCACMLIVAGYSGYYFGYLKASQDVEQRIEASIKELGTPLLRRMTETENKVNEVSLQVEKNKSRIDEHNNFLIERFNIWQWEK